MKETRLLMGMPITVEVENKTRAENLIKQVFEYFEYIDKTFSTYKDTSEISKINRNELNWEEYSKDMRTVFLLSEETKKLTNGYFNILTPKGQYDPSGLVKGWAINNAALILKNAGFKNYYIEAGGDIQVNGANELNKPWSVGIRNPFNREEIVKILSIKDKGVATSGTYIRGDHIYNPLNSKEKLEEIVSLTVIGPNVFEADRFATAAFAMGKNGIIFIENLPGFEAYQINKEGIATQTSGFIRYA